MSNIKECKCNSYEMLKCIWMTSQVVEYKLCDNKFDCEKCLFDQVMRNLVDEKDTPAGGTTDVVSSISEKFRSIKYDNSIIYLKNNLIAREICPRTFYLGMNPILNCFLDAVNSVVIHESGKNIFTNERFINISGDWGTVSLSAPMNFLIYDKVGEPCDIPFRSNWFAIIGGVHKEISGGRLHRGEWDKLHGKALTILEEIKSDAPKVGDTMMDGGSSIKFLHQLIGSERYLNIINSLNS
ncbi:MAG: hypothetical protein WC061_04245 [Melioribacteraceae bacterium]